MNEVAKIFLAVRSFCDSAKWDISWIVECIQNNTSVLTWLS